MMKRVMALCLLTTLSSYAAEIATPSTEFYDEYVQ